MFISMRSLRSFASRPSAPALALLMLCVAAPATAGDGDAGDDDVTVLVAGARAPVDDTIRWNIDTTFTVLGSLGVDRSRLNAVPALGLRFGGMRKVWRDVVIGADLAGHIARDTKGALAINVHQNMVLTTTRLLVGYDLVDSRALTFTPYGFGELMGGVGVASVVSADVNRVSPILSWAGRAGVGAQWRLVGLILRADAAAGVRDFRPEVVGTTSVGLTF
jgi:hypothetical protein